jgi:hypothetical protein
VSKSKSKKYIIDDSKIIKRLVWEATVAEIKDGRRQRAVTFTDRKKEGDRRACRDRSNW